MASLVQAASDGKIGPAGFTDHLFRAVAAVSAWAREQIFVINHAMFICNLRGANCAARPRQAGYTVLPQLCGSTNSIRGGKTSPSSASPCGLSPRRFPRRGHLLLA